ncbi:Protein F02E11.7 b [Aphelenchoides avenae]|nr:Protein F02E11.7 b [Aphelenchus avenae]
MSGTGIETNADGSIAYHEDPYNKPEHENTLRGRELVIFIIGYVIAVIIILALFESILPVVFASDDVGTQQRLRETSQGARLFQYL